MSEYMTAQELEQVEPGTRVIDLEREEWSKQEDGRWKFEPDGNGVTKSKHLAHCEVRLPNDGYQVSILTEAQDTISTSRQADYGDAQVSFKRIADLWSTYLGQDVSAQDVACLMALMKISRIKGDPTKRDSWVDLAGYAGLGGTL